MPITLDDSSSHFHVTALDADLGFNLLVGSKSAATGDLLISYFGPALTNRWMRRISTPVIPAYTFDNIAAVKLDSR